MKKEAACLEHIGYALFRLLMMTPTRFVNHKLPNPCTSACSEIEIAMLTSHSFTHCLLANRSNLIPIILSLIRHRVFELWGLNVFRALDWTLS